jgi:hypothetical protein
MIASDPQVGAQPYLRCHVTLATVNKVVDDFLTGLKARDLARVKLCLHPYLHWVSSDGRTTRGRTNVLALLDVSPVPETPAEYEVGDGQIYRWRERGPSDRLSQ